jgi:hypothetical protein
MCGLGSIFICIGFVLISMVLVVVKNLSQKSVTVLSEEQRTRLNDFELYLERELHLLNNH